MDDPRYQQPPGADPAPFWSAELTPRPGTRRALRQAIASRLGRGEQVRGVFDIHETRPRMNLLVVTDLRVAAVWDADLAESGWRLSVPLPELAALEVDARFAMALHLVERDGSHHRVGTMATGDREVLVEMVGEALDRAPFTAQQLSSGPAAYEVYRPAGGEPPDGPR